MDNFLTTENVEISPEIRRIFKHRLSSAGMEDGGLMIGWLKHMPDSVYLLWTSPGKAPVAMTVPGREVSNPQQAESIADQLIDRWRKTKR